MGYIFISLRQRPRVPSRRFNPWRSTPLEGLALLLLFLTLAVNSGGLAALNRDWIRYSCLFVPSSLLLVWVFARERGVVTRLLSCKTLLFIGNISANAFLIHQVVIRYVQWIYNLTFKADASNGLTAVLSLGITAALSVGFVNARRDALKRVYADDGEAQ